MGGRIGIRAGDFYTIHARTRALDVDWPCVGRSGMIRPMTLARSSPELSDHHIAEVLRKYWGFESLRPLQSKAIRASLDGRDSLVVLPTGGGKSLCYQLPPLLAGRTDIVVSPLISLMKDQVDALRAIGYPAAALHSGLTPEERREVETGLAKKHYRLVFVAPERLLTPSFMRHVEHSNVRSFAVDEAHCVSHWGHDFRREYRKLAALKERFPKAGVHAYTATATQRVRDDILEQLRLDEPEVLVGRFDRPNLVYRVIPKSDEYEQIQRIVDRHKSEAVIVYCISRKNTEAMAEHLAAEGFAAKAYHAGLSPDMRRRTHDEFSQEKLDVVVATVAFGMGIDRSNIRCVVHAALPKSIEHYQQETGRAGRDGLEAECVLLYAYADHQRWESLLTKSAQEADTPPEVLEAALARLEEMRRLGGGWICRHRALSEYFGQAYEQNDCGACDVCLNEMPGTFDGTEPAQKILSCVARVQERFGVMHVADVLRGAGTEMIRNCRHDQLSTYGLMRDTPKKVLTQWIFQLVEQGLMLRTVGDKPVLKLNEASWDIMRGHTKVRLREIKTKAVKRSLAEANSWEGVDTVLFDRVRSLRARLASERGVPPYVIFGDATLRELARQKPASRAAMRQVYGIGERKLADVGGVFLKEIAAHTGVTPREGPGDDAPAAHKPHRPKKPSRRKQAAFEMFARGSGLDEVAEAVGLASSTVSQYLAEYIEAKRPWNIDSWVDDHRYERVARAARQLGAARLKPIFDHLKGEVPYEVIRIVVAHQSAISPPSPEPPDAA